MGKRINWKFDGTLAYRMVQSTGSRIELTADQKAILNGDTRQTNTVDIGGYDAWVFNFPAAILIDKIHMEITNAKTFSVEVSSNSTDGYDGDWTEVLGSTGYTTPNTDQAWAVSPLSATWLRIKMTATSHSWRHIHLFGEYVSPRFEFWAEDGLAELTDNYPLLMANAPNFEDYAGSTGFRLKNTDVDTHSYALAINTVKYGGDAVISSYFTLSTDGGDTKNGSLAISNLGPGETSGGIGVYGDVLIANNPADGYHWFVIEVQETA